MVRLVVALPIRKQEDANKAREIDADLVELRLDYMQDPSSFDFSSIGDLKGKVIITIRDVEEGGVNRISDEAKAKILKSLHDQGFIYDVEARFLLRRPDVPFEGKIVSVHYFDRVPSFEEVESLMSHFEGAWIRKIAVIGKEGYRELLIKFAKRGFAVMPMGTDPLERIAFSILGSELIYANAGEATAPGQMNYLTVKEMLRCLFQRPL